MKHLIYILCLGFMVLGCSNSSDDDGGNTGGENAGGGSGSEGEDGAVALYFPQENMLCNEGTNLTPTESTVYFEWRANTSGNYKITIENLSTGNIIQRETTQDIIPIVIQRATAYKWYVESTVGAKTVESETWQFYNAGPGVESYVPFPAEIISPNMAQSLAATSTVTLQWSGTDVDDDIEGYDVYFGTNQEPTLHTSSVPTEELSVSVTSGTIYYWKIKTKDSVGNISDSGVFQFRVL